MHVERRRNEGTKERGAESRINKNHGEGRGRGAPRLVGVQEWNVTVDESLHGGSGQKGGAEGDTGGRQDFKDALARWFLKLSVERKTVLRHLSSGVLQERTQLEFYIVKLCKD